MGFIGPDLLRVWRSEAWRGAGVWREYWFMCPVSSVIKRCLELEVRMERRILALKIRGISKCSSKLAPLKALIVADSEMK